MPDLRNHLSSETTVEQKINVSDKSNGASFSYPLMSINNGYNFDAHPWPKNTIFIAGNPMINGISEEGISINFKPVKIRCFSGATVDYMYFNLIPLLREKPSALVLHDM